jgi:hypothetical protein
MQIPKASALLLDMWRVFHGRAAWVEKLSVHFGGLAPWLSPSV